MSHSPPVTRNRPPRTAPVPAAIPARTWKRRWQPRKLAPDGPDYRVWRNLVTIQAAGSYWGTTYQDAVTAAVKLRELALLDATLELWPQIRSPRLRSWAADVMTAARWLQLHPLDTPAPARIWPELFNKK